MTTQTFDAVVIGGGPGGYPAAIRLGQLGLECAVVERESLGGVCVNWGCIPSKALIAAANQVDKARRAATMGLTFAEPQIDVAKMQAWKDGIVKKMVTGVKGLLKGNRVEVIAGHAKLVSPTSVEVVQGDGTKLTVEGRRGIIVATGAQVIRIPGFDVDGKVVITAREAVSLPRVPEHLVVIGGGVIGLELGMVYQKLGAKLTIVEMMDGLLPGIDRDLVAVLEKRLRAHGAQILLETKAVSCVIENGIARAVVDQKGTEKTIECDAVLVAVGFRPNSKEVGLENVGVKTDPRGFVITDEQCRTNVPTLFAIGDVSGPPFLAHKATKEGEIAAEVLAGHRAAKDWRALPAAVYTDPEIASTGLSETEAKGRGVEYKIGKYPFSALGRALAVGEPEGYVKVLTDAKSHELLGVHIVGPEASDLIAEATLAIEMCAFAEDVGLTIHAHPTLSEAFMEAANHSVGQAIHLLNR